MNEPTGEKSEETKAAIRAAAIRYLLMLELGRGTFGDALVALKDGRRVARAGWNGKGMWLALTPGSEIKPEWQVVDTGTEEVREESSNLRGAAGHLWLADRPGKVRIGAHIDMRAADGSLVIGWLASQTDMLAEDWAVLP